MRADSKILVIKYSSLGDVVNAIPAVRFLKESLPEASVHWVVKKEFAPILEGLDFLDSTVSCAGGGIGGLTDAIARARSVGADVAVDLQGILRSAVISYFSGAKDRVCFPYTREMSSLFYTRTLGVDRRDGAHAAEENVSVVETLVGRSLKTDDYDFELGLDKQDIAGARGLIGGGAEGPVVVINPVSRWQSKMWGAGKFSSLADMLIEEKDARVVFTGVASDKAYIDSIISTMNGGAENLAGKTTLRTLAALLSISDLAVSCDSGPMHMASAVKTPVVAVFGPTDPSYTGPFANLSEVISAGVECAPCRKRHCTDMRCMEEISPSTVFEAAVRLMETGKTVGESFRENPGEDK